MAEKSRIVAVIGPTASGKSELALALAERMDAEILSVDSMQVYRGMDIGTAKPTAAEQAAVRHRGIDLVDPNETYTVARFTEMADEVIADAGRRGKMLIAVGGTPLYYKALFEGLFDGPSADEAVRARLREMSNEALHARLRDVDAQAASRIHMNDTKRLIRALEVYELTGRPISQQQVEWSEGRMRHEARWLGMGWDRDVLNRRINARVKAMMAAGWVEETRALLERYGGFSSTAIEATGYRVLAEHLQGRVSLEEAGEQIKIATRQLARRQMKWFRRFANVNWIGGTLALEKKLDESLRLIDRATA